MWHLKQGGVACLELGWANPDKVILQGSSGRDGLVRKGQGGTQQRRAERVDPKFCCVHLTIFLLRSRLVTGFMDFVNSFCFSWPLSPGGAARDRFLRRRVAV